MICQVRKETVVLVHGLAAPRWVMSPLGRFLGCSGFGVVNWGYASIRRSIEWHGEALRERLEQLVNSSVDRCHLVTHSMGSIVARCALAGGGRPNVGRVVMLAPPNHGSHVARRLAPYLGFACQPLRQLSDDSASFVRGLPQPDALEIGIIAAASDAVVPLASTRLACQRDHIVLPGRHGLLPLRPDTARQVLTFLREGRFAHPDIDSPDPGKPVDGPQS